MKYTTEIVIAHASIMHTFQGPRVFIPASCLTYGPVAMSGLYYIDYFVICYVVISVLRDVRNVFTFIIQKYQNFRQHDSGTNTPKGRPPSRTSSSMRSATPQASEATVHNMALEHVYQLSEVHKARLSQLPKKVFEHFSVTKFCF